MLLSPPAMHFRVLWTTYYQSTCTRVTDGLIRGLRLLIHTDGDNRCIITATDIHFQIPTLMSVAGHDPHNRSPKVASGDDEDEDPVTKMLRKTGCLEVNTALQVSTSPPNKSSYRKLTMFFPH